MLPAGPGRLTVSGRRTSGSSLPPSVAASLQSRYPDPPVVPSVTGVHNHTDALDRFGVIATSIRRVRRGRNTHWIVRTKTDRFVLRHYAPDCTREEVAYEFAVLHHLNRCGWPVAPPIGDALHSESGIWCVFPYLHGRSPTPRSASGRRSEQMARGRLLARLHADLAALTNLGQRERWLTTPEGLFDRGSKRPAADVLREFAGRDAEGGGILLEYAERAAGRLAELLPSAPPPIVIHGDLTPWNIRLANGRLSAVFDFDVTHLDLRVADFALSWRGTHDGVLDGYEEESPLTEIERGLMIPVYWAWMIACAVADIDEGNGSPEWALTHLLRQPLTVDQ